MPLVHVCKHAYNSKVFAFQRFALFDVLIIGADNRDSVTAGSCNLHAQYLSPILHFVCGSVVAYWGTTHTSLRGMLRQIVKIVHPMALLPRNY